MSVSMQLKVGFVLAALAGVWLSNAQAQQLERGQVKPSQYQSTDPRERPRSDRPDRPRFAQARDADQTRAGEASQEVDQFLANCLAIKNQGEIEMNQFAQQRTQNPEVKNFAEQMIEDHRQLGQQLERLASERPNDPALARLAAIDRSIAERCAEMSREKLAEMSGAQFDECFIGAQIGAHIHMLSALEVIAEQGSGELQQAARDAQATVESHLQHAQELAGKLRDQNMQAGRPTRTQR